MGLLQGLDKILFVKILSDALQQGRGVIIQMNLPVGKGFISVPPFGRTPAITPDVRLRPYAANFYLIFFDM